MIGISKAFAAPAEPPVNSPLDYFIVHVISNTSLVLSITILIIGLVALILQFRVLHNAKAQPIDVLRISAVTLIITFSLSLASFLTANELKEATPIFGLFSTIAGYLLGSAQRQTQSRTTDAEPSA
jgi:uncharacterized BrkB/YihY/UPF0761 family membrane protein